MLSICGPSDSEMACFSSPLVSSTFSESFRGQMATVGVGARREGVGDVRVVFEDHCGFFESSALGLDGVEVHEDGLEAVPDGVDDVVLPVEGIEGDGVDVLVEYERSDDGQAGEGEQD